MKMTRIGIAACVVVAVMTIVGSIQAAVTVVDHRPDVMGQRSNHGRIAMKSTGQPVVALTSATGSFFMHVSEDLTSWPTRSGAWVAGGASSLDITVDSSDIYHFVYSQRGSTVTYVEHTGNRIDVPDSSVWADGSGNVQIVANNDGVSVGWSPRIGPGGGDGWLSDYLYATYSGGGWSAASRLDHLSNNMSPRFLGSADEHYYYSLPVNGYPNPGPFWQQADDGSDADVVSLHGVASTSGTKTFSNHYDFFLSPAWNGGEMNLASIETVSSGDEGVVSLYLDLQGAPSQVVIYDDSADHGGEGTARSVALTAVNGFNYVFFAAEDPAEDTGDPNNTDLEVFVQMVAQDGTLMGSAQQLTSDAADQYELDVVAAPDGSMHLVFQTDPGTGDENARVSYMKVALEFDPQSCQEAKNLGYNLTSDLNDDCYVNIGDFGIFAGEWLDCMDPCDVGCARPWE